MNPIGPIPFNRNSHPSVGIEVELELIDCETLALKSAFPEILRLLPVGLDKAVKPELMQCYAEVISRPVRRVGELREDMTEKIRAVEQAATQCQTRLLWSGTHPFSLWFDQEITPTERYLKLVDAMQDTARRIATFGLHVHVGVDSGDKAIMVIDRIMRHLPTLLALSVNSPFWVRRDTGLHSQRSKIMDALPVAGLPPLMRNWSEYCWVVNHSLQTGFIRTMREIWWDVRPHAGFGTVELRLFDLPSCLDDALALAALSQCLVQALSDQIDEGVYQHDIHPIMVRQNKWRASRYGLEADLIDPVTHRTIPAREQVYLLHERLKPYADTLECVPEFDHLLTILERGTGAARQIALGRETGDFHHLIARLLEHDPLEDGIRAELTQPTQANSRRREKS